MRRGLVIAAALPSLFLFKEIFISSLLFSSPSSAEISSSSTARSTPASPAGRCAWISSTRADRGARSSRSTAPSTTGRGPAAARASSTRRTSARTSSRCAMHGTNGVLYSRGYSSIYAEWETTGEAEEGVAHVPRVAALPVAEGAGPGRAVPTRRRRRLPAALHGRRRPGRREPRAAPAAREGLDRLRERARRHRSSTS